jgi:hypothetical protein
MTPGANATCTTGLNSRLVCLGIELRLAEVSAPPEMPSLKERQASIVSGLTAVSSDLQQISRGIHPAILSTGDPVNRGLGSALKTLARRCPVPVNLDVGVERHAAVHLSAPDGGRRQRRPVRRRADHRGRL